jgi:hypothetical protein
VFSLILSYFYKFYSFLLFHFLICSFLSSFHILYFPVYFHVLSLPPPPSQAAVPQLSCWLPCSVCLHFKLALSSIGPAKFQPCLACSYFSTHFFACDLLTALMMEAARASESVVNFHKTTRHTIPEGCHLGTYLLKTQIVYTGIQVHMNID